MKRGFLAVTAVLLLLGGLAFSQSRETGAIRGVVTDEQNVPLPGVSITLSGPSIMGTRTVVTDAEGAFRFPALPPGVYQLKAELQGFGTTVRENLRVTTTVTLTADMQLKPAALEEEVTVVAQAPTVDVKSTETASVTLSNEILRNIPYSQFTADIVNLAPGVNDNSAYGSSESTGIAYTVDGVNVADPDAGSAWVFLDSNIIEEAKVMGVGLPAEYGNFTGVIFNLVTKSGGNQFAGHLEAIFQGKASDWPKGLWQTNNNAAYIGDFPDLTSPLSKLLDVNAHLGGPIIRDKLWFYIGGQYYRSQDYPTGFPEAIDYKQPRLFTKLTAQLTRTLNVTASFEIDQYKGVNRDGGATVLPEATVTQSSPEIVGNFSLTQILSPKTFFDLKAAFFSGYYYLDPATGFDTYMHYDYADGIYTDNSGYYYYADRARFQANASVTHYVEEFLGGSHDFKFGAEFERSGVRNRYGYTGPDHRQYFDYYGEPYLMYQYEGYDTNTRYTRLEGFVQDSWQVTKRLNVSAGLRFSQNWGDVKGVSGSVYKAGRIAPRVGFTFDILGDKTTILKAHFGQFTEAMLASYHDRMNPSSAYKDQNHYYWDFDLSDWVLFEQIVHEDLFHMDPDIKHPYMQQWTLGIERELFKDTSLGITYVNRRWKDIIGPVDRAANYDQIDYTVPYTWDPATNSWIEQDQTVSIYERTEDTVSTFNYLITNYSPADSPWVLLQPYRKYDGLEVLFNKRFSNRWELLASYVYSRSEGSIDNGFADDIGYGGATDDPNFYINAVGHLTYDPTHMLKLQGTYVVPVIDLSVNAYFHAITGHSWTTRYRTDRLNQGRVTFFLEDRGTNHYPLATLLDLRFEKIFTIAQKYRLGLILDIFNVFNANTITSWGTRIGTSDWYLGDYPSADGHNLFGIVSPRQARVGIRLIF